MSDIDVVPKEKLSYFSITQNDSEANAAITLIVIATIVEMFFMYSNYLTYDLFTRLAENKPYTMGEIESAESRIIMSVAVYALVFIISGIVYIGWFKKCYTNLSIRAEVEEENYWAIVGWIVPILNLFKPYQMMTEMWHKSSELIKMREPNYVTKKMTIVGIWWFFWIFCRFFGGLLSNISSYSETVDGLALSSLIDVFFSALGIPLSILAIIVVVQYAKIERKLAEVEGIEMSNLNKDRESDPA